jgi:ribosomal protection tetracycline resistance protein
MAIVNIGILAHVDAGKTTLTEQILFRTGVIRAVGSVDKGTAQTDTMELERARGISIRAAVTSFQLHDLKVNLIDTPGHSDFVAEVERSLRVLDAVVLVIAAVEGVQSQTRRLARAIRAAQLPHIIFVNKIDRLGARGEALLADIEQKLALRVVAMNRPEGLSERSAQVVACDRTDPAWRDALIDRLAETSEPVIEAFERSGDLDDAFLTAEIRAQVASGDLVPVYFGSAMTGAGVPELLAGLEEWLPASDDASDAALDGSVFKIARQPSGEKLVYVRLFGGRLAVRQKVTLCRASNFGEPEQFEERITALERFADGHAVHSEAADAGEIAILHGLKTAHIDDRLGSGSTARIDLAFPAPALESVVRPRDPAQIAQLRTALDQLAEQDPLISLRQRNDAGELTVRLYGEVQKEVLLDTLVRDYGVDAHFGVSRTICIERPTGSGEAFELIFEGDNPFYATVGFRIEPAEAGSGIRYVRELGSLPPAFYRAVEETVYETFAQGLHGWEVTDCVVTLTHAGFSSVLSTASDFRKLVPLVMLQSLSQAGTEVCEPIEELEVEIPEDTFGSVCGTLIAARATLSRSWQEGATYRLIWQIPSAELHGIEQQLPGLTRGDGSWVSSFAGYMPVSGEPPERARVGPNPLNRAHYLADVARGQFGVMAG